MNIHKNIGREPEEVDLKCHYLPGDFKPRNQQQTRNLTGESIALVCNHYISGYKPKLSKMVFTCSMLVTITHKLQKLCNHVLVMSLSQKQIKVVDTQIVIVYYVLSPQKVYASVLICSAL